MTRLRKHVGLLVALQCAVVSCYAAPRTLPISQAGSVLAVYESHPRERIPSLIVAAWPNGKIVWSKNREAGGPPYFSAKLDPKKVRSLIDQFEEDGLLSDKDLNRPHLGPDAGYTTLLVRSNGKGVEMSSWHEGLEGRPIYAGSRGIAPLNGRRRLEVMKEEPADYLFFRYVWSDVRSRITDLIPKDGTITAEHPVFVDGELTWSLEGDAAR